MFVKMKFCLVSLIGALVLSAQAHSFENHPPQKWVGRVVKRSALPCHAQQLLKQIAHGGPFAYQKDGSVFGNYERRLLFARRGYYREYTVQPTSGRGRGAKRIVCGGARRKISECYYSSNHYRTFRFILLD